LTFNSAGFEALLTLPKGLDLRSGHARQRVGAGLDDWGTAGV